MKRLTGFCLLVSFLVLSASVLPAAAGDSRFAAFQDEAVEQLALLDTAPFSSMLAQALASSQPGIDAEQYLATVREYLADIAAQEESYIVAGCMTEAVASMFNILAAGIYYGYLALDSGLDDYDSCSVMYAALGLTFVSRGLARWIDYRICAEDYAFAPDQDVISRLIDDRLFLTFTTVSFFAIANTFATYCNEDLFPLLQD